MAVNMENPTQAPGYSILHTIQDVLNGRAENTDLEPALAASRTALDETEANFVKAWETLEPRIQEPCTSLKESVHGYFEQIRIALGWVDETADSGNKDILSTSANTINRCNFQLNLLFVHLRNTVWSLQGPTEIPNLNAFIWANDFYQADESQSKALQELIAVEQRTSASALVELQNGPQTREVVALQEAFKSHAAAIEALASALSANDKAKVAADFEEVRTNFVRLQELVPAAQLSQRTAGPTKSPQVNAVLSFTEDLLKDRIQDIVLMNALEVLYRDHVSACQTYQRLSAQPSDSVMINEEVQLAGKAYALQQQAFDHYTAFFSGRAVHMLERARTTLIEAAEAIERSHQNLLDLAAREGKTLCIRCGEYNPPDRNRCQKCSATLPLVFLGLKSSTFDGGEDPHAEKVQRPVLTGNMVRLYTAVNRVAEESITDEQFLAELDWFEGVVAKLAEKPPLPDLEALSEQEREYHERVLQKAEQSVPLLQEAVHEYEEGLEKFREFLDSRDPSVLEDGVMLCNRAALKLVEVRDLPKKVEAPAPLLEA